MQQEIGGLGFLARAHCVRNLFARFAERSDVLVKRWTLNHGMGGRVLKVFANVTNSSSVFVFSATVSRRFSA